MAGARWHQWQSGLPASSSARACLYSRLLYSVTSVFPVFAVMGSQGVAVVADKVAFFYFCHDEVQWLAAYFVGNGKRLFGGVSVVPCEAGHGGFGAGHAAVVAAASA